MSTDPKLGRANPAGYQVLYVADRRDTALAETHITHAVASVAEFCIQLGKSVRVVPIGEMGKSVRVVPIGEMTQIIRTGRGFQLDAYREACSGEGQRHARRRPVIQILGKEER